MSTGVISQYWPYLKFPAWPLASSVILICLAIYYEDYSISNLYWGSEQSGLAQGFNCCYLHRRQAWLCLYLTWAAANGTGSCEWSPKMTGVEWSPVTTMLYERLPFSSALLSPAANCLTISSAASKYFTYIQDDVTSGHDTPIYPTSGLSTTCTHKSRSGMHLPDFTHHIADVWS